MDESGAGARNTPNKGRGALSNTSGRFENLQHEKIGDDWCGLEQSSDQTQIYIDRSKTIVSYNQSPDVPFDRSVNPYKGCEHGCIYCFARPTHAYLGLSPGLDFETKIHIKPNAKELLQTELSARGYHPMPLALGANTDAYQPVERSQNITRGILETLEAYSHPLTIITKSSLVERDIDLLTRMAARDLVSVSISVTTLNSSLARKLEPRAAAPKRRLQTIRTLSEAGIPVGVLVAPVIPGLNDHEIERILASAAQAGAQNAGYVFLRLPLEVAALFRQWLQVHEPMKADKIMHLIQAARGGKDYQSEFGARMRGDGEYAKLVAKRFELAVKRNSLANTSPPLSTTQFQVPLKAGVQLPLFY